jgi:phospholipase C
VKVFAHLSVSLLAFAIAGCALPFDSARDRLGPPMESFHTASSAREALHPSTLGNGLITHVVIIVQENRSVDNLFQFLPGANTQSWGYNSRGQTINLVAEPLTAPYDLGHKHKSWISDYNGGQMNGWNKEATNCETYSQCPPKGEGPYAYVPQYEVEPYYTMAEQYTFADEMFQTNQGPSFPAHQYLISGTSSVSDHSSLLAAENPRTPSGRPTGGCNSPPGSLVELIDASGEEGQTTYPCFNRNSMMADLQKSSVSWHYYQASAGAGFWKAADAIKPIWRNQDFYRANVIHPSAQVLKDISDGRLASVSWVTPTQDESDHALHNNGSGPSWVASVVNAIGKSRYWDSTAIFVVWDEWGGWYDHVPPPEIYNSYELGFRVPLIVISPYAKTGYVSHTVYEFGSLLKFTEEVFGLRSLHTTDERANDLSDCFNFGSAPRAFKPIAAPLHADYFLRQIENDKDPDDDGI